MIAKPWENMGAFDYAPLSHQYRVEDMLSRRISGFLKGLEGMYRVPKMTEVISGLQADSLRFNAYIRWERVIVGTMVTIPALTDEPMRAVCMSLYSALGMGWDADGREVPHVP